METLLQQIINGLVLGSMYALVALGYTMVYGIIGLINFAHGDVLMVGALTSWTIIVTMRDAMPGAPGWLILLLAVALWVQAERRGSRELALMSLSSLFTGLGGLVPMFLIQLGEVLPGGVGSGLSGMLVFAILSVFVAGRLVGRTPDFLGKKIAGRERKFALLAELILPPLAAIYAAKGVEMRCCPDAKAILTAVKGAQLKDATEQDWFEEYLAPVIAVKVVDSLDEAMAHINQYGSHHTDAILTTNHPNAMRFIREVDSASVMINASTRFADGFEYGLGAEIGISTDKIHARGPVGLEGLTSQKWIVFGNGEIRR